MISTMRILNKTTNKHTLTQHHSKLRGERQGNYKTRVKGNLEQNSISTEKLELFHGGGVEGDDGIVIVDRLIHNQTIGGLFPLQDRRREVLLPSFPVPKKVRSAA